MCVLRFIGAVWLVLGIADVVGAPFPELSLDRSARPLRVSIKGEIGRTYCLESAPALGRNDNWTALLTLTLTNRQQHWFDAAAVFPLQRFYRAADLLDVAPVEAALNFRLIDHTGRSQELAYHTEARAVVLVFTGNGCPKIQRMLGTIKSLRDQFASQQVIFWLVNANAPDTRDSIAAEAANLGIDLPILHDDAQLVARAYRASQTAEAIAISTTDWTIFYRGAIDDRAGTDRVSTTQSYLADALAQFLGNQIVSFQRTVPEGSPIVFNPRREISYSADIAPLLLDRCVRCHSPGNIAPFAMTNYTVVADWASNIKRAILAGAMPPWHADPRFGVFTNDSSLTPAQKALLVQWIDDGAPRGPGVDPLATRATPANFPHAWPAELGQPDVVLNIPRQDVPATGLVDYRYLTVELRNRATQWLRAAVVRPGNARVVHHCKVDIGSGSAADGSLPASIANYVPGANPLAYPPNTGKRVPPSAQLTFQMHYITTGQPETDQTQLGLYFSPVTPALELLHHTATNMNILILPGEKEYEREARFTPSKTRDIWLYELRPHMHFRGTRMQYEALYPNGTSEILLSVPKFDFHWQTTYRLKQPKRLPTGTVIRVSGAFDNSAQNLENPNPNVTVTYGLQSEDEMFNGHTTFALIP
ncbi:MAG: redoxin domain-containing protein [Verrucomicrobia bacterium]|nr:redoxin domain-containing protein [Verrucomicrobiota bacterium]